MGKSQELSRSNFINRMLYGKIKKEDIPYSDLRVETEDGILDASIPVQLRNLKEFLSEYMEKE